MMIATKAMACAAVIEGANHGFTPCTECERSPGQYANALRNFHNHVRDWINARY